MMSSSPRRPRRRTPLLGVLVLLSLLAVACGGSDTPAADSAAATGGDLPRVDASVLTGSASTVSGENFDLGDLAGTDLVVWFWAPW